MLNVDHETVLRLRKAVCTTACQANGSFTDGHACHEHHIWNPISVFAATITLGIVSKLFLLRKNWGELRCHAASRLISCAISVQQAVIGPRPPVALYRTTLSSYLQFWAALLGAIAVHAEARPRGILYHRVKKVPHTRIWHVFCYALLAVRCHHLSRRLCFSLEAGIRVLEVGRRDKNKIVSAESPHTSVTSVHCSVTPISD